MFVLFVVGLATTFSIVFTRKDEPTAPPTTTARSSNYEPVFYHGWRDWFFFWRRFLPKFCTSNISLDLASWPRSSLFASGYRPNYVVGKVHCCALLFCHAGILVEGSNWVAFWGSSMLLEGTQLHRPRLSSKDESWYVFACLLWFVKQGSSLS
jgi:hypothetical protein